ncbi:zinc transporter ZIP1-like [Hetaerina americana]|uniref:zinc transporter ZIP1-like n=1 Tax=Hetaerina americana TaxID=62018 RepID=UPI003A7F3AA6
MDVIFAKCIVLFTLLFITFLFTMLPLKLMWNYRHIDDSDRRARYARIISLLSCFAGGVFMGTGLLDLFPEVDDTLSKALGNLNMNQNFPVPEFTVILGFFIVLVIEQIALDYKERAGVMPVESEGQRLLTGIQRQLVRHGSIEGISDHVVISHSCGTSIDGESILGRGGDESLEPAAHSRFRSFLLLTALSVHSLFEGLAIGLQPNVDALLQIFVAVALHKLVIAFSLGLNLVQSELEVSSIVKSNLLFCLTTPIGLAIGMGVEEFGHSMYSSAINGVLQGLSCGTFVYVTFFEVLPHELNIGQDRLMKVLAILIGFSFVCGVIYLDPS